MNYTEITSRKNKTVLSAAELFSKKKARDESGTFPVEGFKLLEEAISAGLEISELFFTQNALDNFGTLLEKAGCASPYLVTDEVYAKISGEEAPQGIFASVRKPSAGALTDSELEKGGFVLLEDIQNPLNIGAVLRCCYAMGFEKVIFSSACADIYSPKCARAAMGSLFRITPYFTDNMPETVKKITSAGNRVFCTRLDKDSLRLGTFEFAHTDSFVIGNEGHGASGAVSNACSGGLFIPMNDGAESLNAAAAAAIVMWEMKKSHLCR